MSEDALAGMPADIDRDVARFVWGVSRSYAEHPSLDTVDPVEARRICERVRSPWTKGGPKIAAVYEETLRLSGGEMRLRVYDPDPSRLKPAFIYLHGGGFCLFSLDTHDRLMREYANRSGFVVLGFDYPLAPEVKFPVALRLIVESVKWLSARREVFGADTSRLFMGGDSAGANLSVGASLILRDEGLVGLLKGLVLNYGAFAHKRSPEAIARYGGPGYMLNDEECDAFVKAYLADPADIAHPLVSPINAALNDLPPALFIVPECDILTEQSYAFADKLKAAGGRADFRLYKGATHSFLESMSIARLANLAIDDTAAWLRARA